MIGTTVKLGFDGSSVKSGLASVGNMFGRFGKQVGIGFTRQIGAQGMDAITRLVTAIPSATNEMMGYVGGLTDIRSATGSAIKELMVLEEAMRLAGAEGDINRMIFTFQRGMQEAGNEAGELQKKFNEIGIYAPQLRGMAESMTVTDQIKEIFQILKDQNVEAGKANELMALLFGGRFGANLKKALQDLPALLDQANSNVGVFAEELEGTANDIDNISDTLGRMRMVIRELSYSFLKGFVGGFGEGADATTKMVNTIRSLAPLAEGIGRTFSGLFEPAMKGIEWIGEQIKEIGKQGFGKWFEEMTAGSFVKIGEQIGEGFKSTMPAWLFGRGGAAEARGPGMIEKIGEAINKILPEPGAIIGEDPIGDFKRSRMVQDLKPFLDLFKGGQPDNKTSMNQRDLIKETQNQTVILDRILREKGTPMFV